MTNGQEARPQIDASTHESTAQRRDRVEGELHALQEQHRLGVHVFEKSETYEFPTFSYGCFYDSQEAYQDDLNAADSKNPMMLSASLLLKSSSGKSMQPYISWKGLQPVCGYLIDLSDEQEGVEPARVYRAYEEGLNSGENFPRHKKLRLEEKRSWKNEELYKLYDYESEQQAHVAKVASDTGVEFTAKQLDALGKNYSLFREVEDDVCSFNEIVISAQKDHIKAISVVSYEYEGVEADFIHNMERFVAAVTGLKHIAKGMDVPVVTYRVNGQERGQQQFIGQGKEELAQVIRESLLAMIHDPVLAATPTAITVSDAWDREKSIDNFIQAGSEALIENGIIGSRQELEDELGRMVGIAL